MSHSLFVSVGSRFTMDRLLLAVDQFLASHPGYHAFAQTGKTQATLKHIDTQEWLSAEAFMQAFLECDIFISHAGMGNILLAAEHNKSIIIMPRQANNGEHINDHQLDTAEGLKDRKFIHSVHSNSELGHAILQLSNSTKQQDDAQKHNCDWPERTRLINSLHDFLHHD